MFEITILGMEVNWLAQIFGFFSLIIMIIGYQKPRKQFLMHSTYSALFVLVEAALLGGWTAIVRYIISVIRNTIIVLYLRKGKSMPFFWIPVFIIVTITASALTMAIMGFAWYDFLPPIISILFTVSACINNYKLTKVGVITVESSSAVYCIFIGAYIGVIRNTLLAIAALVSFVILFKRSKPLEASVKEAQAQS